MRGVLVAAGVAQSEGVVEVGRLAEVEGAGGSVAAVVGFEEVEDVGDLRGISRRVMTIETGPAY